MGKNWFTENVKSDIQNWNVPIVSNIQNFLGWCSPQIARTRRTWRNIMLLQRSYHWDLIGGLYFAKLGTVKSAKSHVETDWPHVPVATRVIDLTQWGAVLQGCCVSHGFVLLQVVLMTISLNKVHHVHTATHVEGHGWKRKAIFHTERNMGKSSRSSQLTSIQLCMRMAK